jgi:hypothetical protein
MRIAFHVTLKILTLIHPCLHSVKCVTFSPSGKYSQNNFGKNGIQTQTNNKYF